MHRLGINPVFNERIFSNALFYGFRFQAVRRNRPDNAVPVAGRHHIHRYRARHGDSVFDRLMTITVAERNLIAGNAGHQDNPVGCGRTVGYMICPVSTKYSCGIFFALPYRSGMV